MQIFTYINLLYSSCGFFNPSSNDSSKFYRMYKIYSTVVIIIVLAPILMKTCKLMFEDIKTVDQFIKSTFLLPEFMIGACKAIFVLKKQNDFKKLQKLLKINECTVKTDVELLINAKYNKTCK